MKKTLPILAALFGAAALTAQTITVPQGMNAVEGNSSNTYPWARGNGYVRQQIIYDSSHFTAQSVNAPVLIHQLRWRANSTATAYIGGTYGNVTIRLATATVDQAAINASFAANCGADLQQCYSGNVTVLPLAGVATGTPNIFYVDVPLTTPFLYEPALGDLVVEVELPAGSTGSFGACDAQTTGALASRLYSTVVGSSTGSIQTSHGLVMEIVHAPAPNPARKTVVGSGCYSQHRSFYEDFPGQAALSFDLAGSAVTPRVIDMLPNNGTYVVMPGAPAYYPPNTAAGALLSNAATPGVIADGNFTVPLTLPWTFNYPGGSTNVIHAAADGYLHLGATTATTGDYSATPEELLSLHPRLAIAWYDWYVNRNLTTHPDAGIYYDVDPSGQTVYVTWHNIGEFATAAAGTCVVNFQIALHQSGRVEYRYAGAMPFSTTGNVAWTRLITGFSPGAGATNPGSVDLSSGVPFVTYPADLTPPALNASARPIVGTTVDLITSNAGPATGGLLLLSFLPGTGADLGAFGMPGCNGYVDLASAIQLGFAVTGGVGSVPIAIPNSPSLNGFTGHLQSGVLVPGYNSLGALASNGLRVTLGLN